MKKIFADISRVLRDVELYLLEGHPPGGYVLEQDCEDWDREQRRQRESLAVRVSSLKAAILGRR